MNYWKEYCNFYNLTTKENKKFGRKKMKIFFFFEVSSSFLFVDIILFLEKISKYFKVGDLNYKVLNFLIFKEK